MFSHERIHFPRLPDVNFKRSSARRKYIITGGPGFGITTVIDCLRKLDYQAVREAARFVIEQETARKGSDILPWENRDRFDIALRDQKIADYQTADSEEICFFDRGLPDFVGWRRYLNLSIEEYIRAIEEHPYERTVFITQPWKDIYERTALRPLAYEESKLLHEYLIDGYDAIGCRIIVMPKMEPNQRARFVLDALGEIDY
jgi:predicted ATPase